MGWHNAAAQAQKQQQQPAQAQPKKEKTARGGFFGSQDAQGQAYLGSSSESQRNTFLGY